MRGYTPIHVVIDAERGADGEDALRRSESLGDGCARIIGGHRLWHLAQWHGPASATARGGPTGVLNNTQRPPRCDGRPPATVSPSGGPGCANLATGDYQRADGWVHGPQKASLYWQRIRRCRSSGCLDSRVSRGWTNPVGWSVSRRIGCWKCGEICFFLRTPIQCSLTGIIPIRGGMNWNANGAKVMFLVRPRRGTPSRTARARPAARPRSPRPGPAGQFGPGHQPMRLSRVSRSTSPSRLKRGNHDR